MENEIPRRLIDIEKLFRDKNPRLLKFIPGFVIRYLKRITHQEMVNGYIWKHRDLSGLPFVAAILEEFGISVEGRLPGTPESWQGRRLIIAANHPLGGMDGMALMHVAGKVRPDILFPVNDLLLNVPGLKPLFIPINKHGRNTENVKIINDTFESDHAILYFPAGLVSRKFPGGIITDLEWKKTFITKARQYRRDILPAYIDGRNSDWFYNLARWRKKLGIKANIEMLYLVDEMDRQRGKTIHIRFGELIPYTTFTREKSDQEWAEWVRGKAYGIN